MDSSTAKRAIEFIGKADSGEAASGKRDSKLPIVDRFVDGLPGGERVYFLAGKPGISQKALGRMITGCWIESDVVRSALIRTRCWSGQDVQQGGRRVRFLAREPPGNIIRSVRKIPIEIADLRDVAGVRCWCLQDNVMIVWWSPENLDRVAKGFQQWWVNTLKYHVAVQHHAKAKASAKSKRSEYIPAAPAKPPYKLMLANQWHLGENCQNVMACFGWSLAAMVHEVAEC